MRHLLLFSGFVLLLLAAGCTNFDYVGGKFPPTPDSEPVEYFQGRDQIPPGEYRIIGRATLTAPDGTAGYDIRELLLEKARAHGADAVCQVRARKLDSGFYDREEPDPLGPQKPLDPANVDFKGAPNASEAEKAEYGDPVTLRGEIRSWQKVVVQVLLLKKKTAAEHSSSEAEIAKEPEKTAEPASAETPAAVQQ